MTSSLSSNHCTVAVLGGGSFGTALADITATKGHTVRQWMRSKEQADAMNRAHINTRYLPEYEVSEKITATSDFDEAIDGADLIIVAIPSKAFRSVVKRLKGRAEGKLVISTTKGVEAGTFDLMTDILHQEVPGARIGVLSGPNLAKEIMAKCITATVIASEDDELCQAVQTILHCDYFRVYSNHDRYGVEMGGALKNIYAIVAGLATSLGMGDNTRSMLITRGLAEMSRFAVTMGANPMTFLGLSGVGDLIVTCESKLSRNFRVGYALGEGKTLKQAEQELGQVAEGVNTLSLVRDKAREKGVYMPIVDGLYAIILEGQDIREVTSTMMMREQKTDVEFSVRPPAN
ncbi:NAD(P)H-dependent glycerol-3-phosphate dehydrogenase [Sansalvadorimonas sp. 2012CJ34-2]|uniref:Glycerol-3-phosphate dehydrogenase [NAD(P)+] n=1 Tax=Parendozoicomonas callyspongiae TaxID=2942213 RepID=A0ABT0PBM5_9GAMM|nr:NAD(P)H-dependent glycerol-3-phosphate dehydrogenase [Sansalvadorimonas sp. 2012CJ34-2]MCL6268656.1 NAD(P)H-dependent glycerol-3-phosphate dehydrogenase [Sansalvadorimonas sp. 2012CJ34-2]